EIAVDWRAADQDENVGPERGRLVDGSPVVLPPGAQPVRVARRKETATAQARNAKARVTNEASAPADAAVGDLVPPEADPADPQACAAIHRLRQRPAVDGDLVEADPAHVRERRRPFRAGRPGHLSRRRRA